MQGYPAHCISRGVEIWGLSMSVFSGVWWNHDTHISADLLLSLGCTLLSGQTFLLSCWTQHPKVQRWSPEMCHSQCCEGITSQRKGVVDTWLNVICMYVCDVQEVAATQLGASGWLLFIAHLTKPGFEVNNHMMQQLRGNPECTKTTRTFYIWTFCMILF